MLRLQRQEDRAVRRKGGQRGRMLPGEKEHKGSIYGVSWSADSKKSLRALDKTVKLWDVESKACEATMHVSAKPTVQDMQVGCTYAGDQIISLSLSGDLNYLDPSSPSAPTRIVQAHASPVLAIATDLGAADGSLYSGGGGGDVVAWSESGAGVRLSGQGPWATSLGGARRYRQRRKAAQRRMGRLPAQRRRRQRLLRILFRAQLWRAANWRIVVRC